MHRTQVLFHCQDFLPFEVAIPSEDFTDRPVGRLTGKAPCVNRQGLVARAAVPTTHVHTIRPMNALAPILTHVAQPSLRPWIVVFWGLPAVVVCHARIVSPVPVQPVRVSLKYAFLSSPSVTSEGNHREIAFHHVAEVECRISTTRDRESRNQRTPCALFLFRCRHRFPASATIVAGAAHIPPALRSWIKRIRVEP